MQLSPSYAHLFHLIIELREAAIDNQAVVSLRDDVGFGYGLGAALANDAADALEAMLAERHVYDRP